MRRPGTGSGMSWLSNGSPTGPVANGCDQHSAIWAMPALTALPGSARVRRWNSMLAAERIRAERFHASYDGDARSLAARAWDIDGLASGYRQWLERARELVRPADHDQSDEEVFAIRSELVHEWRKFLFIDPGLPGELLPARWPGKDAAELFRAEAKRLLPAAGRFVDWCLAGGGPCQSGP